MQVPPNSLFEFDAFEVELLQHHELAVAHQKSFLEYARTLSEQRLPILLSSDGAEAWLGFDKQLLYAIAFAPDKFYRQFSIKKSNGGVRSIHAPLPTLKEIQRRIAADILSKIIVNKASHAYSPRNSVRKNARIHLRQPEILKMDVLGFFPSIRFSSIVRVFSECGYTEKVSELLAGLCCLYGSLPQGAPTSPALSNIIMREFDQKLLAHFTGIGMRYTRYADDITISGNQLGREEIGYVSSALSELGMEPNWAKTRIFGKGASKVVTGILVNERLRVPNEKRRELRQEFYFISRYGLRGHAARRSEKPQQLLRRLHGYASYAAWVDPHDQQVARIRTALRLMMKKRAEFVFEVVDELSSELSTAAPSETAPAPPPAPRP